MSDAGQEAVVGAQEEHEEQHLEEGEEGGEPSLLEQEREKHRRRAEKFGTKYVDPARRKDLRDVARKERFGREGFATGIDLFAEEEQQKLRERAERFGLPSSGLQFVPPAPDEDAAKRRARAERFGVEYQPPDETGLMDVDLLEQRKDADPTIPRRPEAVHVYGVDLMSTGDCLRYFADYGPTYVEWINDSCCNVLFRDAPTAKRAVVGLGRPLPPEEMPDLAGLDASDPASIELLWYKGEDFQKGGTAIPLIFRIATVRDVKPQPGEGEGRHISRRLWQQGGGQGGRGRGRFRGGRGGGRGPRQRQREWQGEGEGEGEGGAEGEGEEDAEMRQARGPRGGRRWNKRRREGDVEMGDADWEEGGDEEGGGQRSVVQRPRLELKGRMFASALGGAAAAPQLEREQVSYDDL